MLPGWKTWLRVGIGVVLLLALFVLADWRQGLNQLLGVRWSWALVAAFLFPVTLYISAWKWQLFVAAQGVTFDRWRLCRYYWIGFFFNNFLPSSVGGDVTRLALFRRTGRLAEIAASILAERLSGIVVLLGLAVMGLSLRSHYFDFPGLLPLFWLISLGGLVFLLGLYLAGRSLSNWLESRSFDEATWSGLILSKLRKVVRAMLVIKGHAGVLTAGLAFSLVFYVVTALYYHLLFVALGLEVSFSDIWFIFPIITLAGLIPVSFNALGITEGAFVLFFSQAGLAPGEALAAAILSRMLGLVVSAVGGLLYLFERTDSHSEIR